MNTKLVTSLELSRELKELGVKQESEFYWYNSMATGGKWIVLSAKGFTTPIKFLLQQDNLTSAFLSGELGEKLPEKCPKHNTSLQICHSFSGGWFVGYGDHMNLNGCHVEDDKNLAEAMGKMLVYLIKNNLIKR